MNTGQLVEIGTFDGAPPKFASRPQLRTFGLTGEVLHIDVKNDLVEVETYLKEEGILVTHWYPVQVSISSTFYMQLLSQQIPKLQKDTDDTGVRRGGQEPPPPLAGQNSMFFDFFERK